MTAPPRSAYIAWIAVCVIWGTTYLGIRVALEAVPPMLMGGIRWTIAGVLLAAFALARGHRLPGLALWPSLALQGLLMLGFGNGFVNWAEQHVPSGLAAVTLATSPFWMSGVEALRSDGERLSRGALAGLILGFLGILVLVWPDMHLGDSAGLNFTLGVIALQLACLGWAIGSSYSKRHPHGSSVFAATAVQMVFGGLMMLLAGTSDRRMATRPSRRPGAVGARVSDGGRVNRRLRLVHLRVAASARGHRLTLRLREPPDCRRAGRARPW